MTPSASGAPPRFWVYTRERCGLCDEFIAELASLLEVRGLGFAVADVDADAVARRRFGLKVPVLTCDGHVVCHGRLDRGAVVRLL
ncbi:MAG: glutaredoxin family protein [Gammaproteobacteria bacterium]